MAQRPDERTFTSGVFGRDIEFTYSDTWLGYSLLGLRVVMAWVFLQAGLEKLVEGGVTDPLYWTSQDFLEFGISENNPLEPVFTFFIDYTGVVDPLVIFGQILIGLALLLGVVFRFAALMGGLQMAFFWTAAWEGGLTAGFPVEHGYFVTSELVYVLLLFGLGAWGAGRILGIDAYLERTKIVEDNPWLRYFLG